LDSARLRITQVHYEEETVIPELQSRHFKRPWGKEMGHRPEEEETHRLLIQFFTSFFPAAFARERFFDTLSFAGLQVKGVALNLLDDVFLLHLALETTQRVLEGLTLLKSYFRQLTTPPNSSRWTR
jgi:hypothetical protein